MHEAKLGILIVALHGLLAGCTTLAKCPCDSPEAVVRAYCQADFDGATLSSKSYEMSCLPKITAPSEGGTPGWDTASLISEFTISHSGDSHVGEQDVTVRFNLLGPLTMLCFEPGIRDEYYVFHTRKTGDKWMVMDPHDLPPHISVNSAIRQLLSLQPGQDTRTLVEQLQTLGKNLKHRP
jgi:hypothetical protein